MRNFCHKTYNVFMIVNPRCDLEGDIIKCHGNLGFSFKANRFLHIEDPVILESNAC